MLEIQLVRIRKNWIKCHPKLRNNEAKFVIILQLIFLGHSTYFKTYTKMPPPTWSRLVKKGEFMFCSIQLNFLRCILLICLPRQITPETTYKSNDTELDDLVI